MLRRAVVLLSLILAAGWLAGCVKRISVSAGGDRQIVAGQMVHFGQPVEVPAGAKVVWRMGDGTELVGPRVEHAFQQAGDFEVQVQVTDPDGKQRLDQARIQVGRPALLDVLPADSRYLLLFDRPGSRLADVPLLVERLLAAGQDANALLAEVREAVGFDPFSADGWRRVGLDPDGGLALVGLADGRAPVLVAGLLPGGAALDALRGLLSRRGRTKEQPAEADGRITEVREVDRGELVAAYTVFRGQLWLVLPGQDESPPVQSLSAVLRAKAAPGLSANPDFVRAWGLRPEPGGLFVYLGRQAIAEAVAREPRPTDEQERRLQQLVVERMAFLRGDLDLQSRALGAQLRLGLDGEEIKRLAEVLKARNPVPPFRKLVAPERHLLLKLSADWPGLAAALVRLGEGGDRWPQVEAEMDQFAAASGIPLRRGILQNLGDSLLVSVRFHPAALLGLAGRPAGPGPALGELFEGLAYLQLRDAKLFFATLEQLCAREGGLEGVVPARGSSGRLWRIGPPGLGLVLLEAPSMALLATSEATALAARERLAKPAEAPAAWPETLAGPKHQVLAVDLDRLLADVERAEPPAGNATAAVAKGMVAMARAKLGQLELFNLDAVVDRDLVTLSARLTLR